MVVFDKNDKDSYDNLESWLEEIRKHAPDDAVLIFVGNKCDLESQVSSDEIQEKALRYQLPYIEVSAKTGEQIDSLFEIVARKIVEIRTSKKNDQGI